MVSVVVSQVVGACRDGPLVVWFNPLFNIFVATFFPIQLPSHIKKIPLPWGKPSLIKQIQMKSFKDNLNNKNHSSSQPKLLYCCIYSPVFPVSFFSSLNPYPPSLLPLCPLGRGRKAGEVVRWAGIGDSSSI